MALSTLQSKEKKKIDSSPVTPFHHEQHHSYNTGPTMHVNPPHYPLPANGVGQMGYGPVYQDMNPHPVRYRGFNQNYRQQRPTFAPRPFPAQVPLMNMPGVPIVQPHLNPHFIPQTNPRFELSPMHTELPIEEGMPTMPVEIVYEPTPQSRLSPRSAK
jgi:hypothetical protein